MCGMPHLLGHSPCANGAWNAPYSDKWYIDNFYIPKSIFYSMDAVTEWLKKVQAVS
jgi:hypothetical protein